MGRTRTGSVLPFRGKFKASVGREHLGLFATEQEAWDVVTAWLETEADRAPDSLSVYGEQWFEQREADGVVRGLRQERSVWRAHISKAPFFDYPIKRITPKHVHDWLRKLLHTNAADTITMGRGDDKQTVVRETGRKLSRQSVVHCHRVLSSCLAQAVIDGKCNHNVCKDVRVPKVARVIEDADTWAYLEPAEIERLFALPELTVSADASVFRQQMAAFRRAVFAVAIYAGLREGELWGLRWQDVELDGEQPRIKVRRSFDGATKSKHGRREVPLRVPRVREALRAWKRHGGVAKVAGLVFPADGGGCYSEGYSAGWTDHQQRYDGELTSRAGLRSKAKIRDHVRFHDLRHTCASHLVAGTWGQAFDLYEVCRIMGHSDISVTQRYAHLAPGNLHDKARGMDREEKST